jgi:hypothetical protein
MQQSRELLFLLLSRAFAHTAQPLGHAFPALRRARVRLYDVLLGLRSSLHCLRRSRCPFVRLLHGYYTEVRLLRRVHVRRSALAFPDRPVTTSGTAEVSRFSCMKLLSVRGVFDYAGPECWLAISRQHRCCLPRLRQSRHPDSDFRSSIPGPPMPLSTLQVRPRGDPRKTRGQDGFAISFPVGLFHPLLHAGCSENIYWSSVSNGVGWGVSVISTDRPRRRRHRK